MTFSTRRAKRLSTEIANLIRTIFDVPIAIFSMIDAHRQWYKAATGIGTNEVDLRKLLPICPRRNGPAHHSGCDEGQSRFRNPRVLGEPHIRFYAGMPLRTRDGFNIGTICAIGLEPREFSAKHADILADLARIVMDELELRQLATQDILTGVLSRRAFKDEASRLFGLAKRTTSYCPASSSISTGSN